MSTTTEEKIAKMYESQLATQKEQLDTDYAKAVSDLDAQQQKNQQYTDANLNRTAVEAQKAAVNNAELHNAYGLSSGARAQARLAQENQLQADMTALRAAQQNADADIERQRSLMAQEYASAIRQAQAENDLAKAQALYENAKQEEARLLARQEAAAKLMAEAGDFSRLGALYGLSAKEIAALSGALESSTEPEKETPITPVQTEPNAPDVTTNPNAPGIPMAFFENQFDTHKNDTVEAMAAIIKEAMGNGNKQNTAMEQDDDLRVDQNSIDALGFGPISEESLNELVAAGLVEEYVENGYIKFRRKYLPTAGAALNPIWKQGG